MRIKNFTMSISFLVILLACGVSVAYGNKTVEFRKYSSDQIDEKKAKDVGFCIGQILCVEKKPEILQSMMYAADYPELYTVILEAYEMAYSVKAEDTEEWWHRGPYETACPKTLAEQTYLFTDWATILAEDFAEYECEVIESPRCDAYFKMLTFGDDTIDEYKKKKVCTDENYAKRIAADQAKSQDVMKKMGFGGR